MNMIDYIETLKEVRPIYNNINEERITPYINEVISLYVIPALGAALYKKIETNPDSYSTLLNGGYYANDTKWFEGLKKAIAYLTYSRLLQNNQVSLTTYGIDHLESEYSEKVDERELTYQRNQAKEIGQGYFNRVIEYCSYMQLIECPANGVASVKSKNKFKVIDERPSTNSASTIFASVGSGSGKEYLAGDGLKLDGATFSVDFDKVGKKSEINSVKSDLEKEIKNTDAKVNGLSTDITTLKNSDSEKTNQIAAINTNLLSTSSKVTVLDNKVDTISDKINNVPNIVVCTQEEYDALTPITGTIYYILDL